MKLFKFCVFIVSMLLFSIIGYAQKNNKIYLESEEQVLTKKNKVCKISCGCHRPIRIAGFVTNPPFGWVTIVENKGGTKQYVTNGYAIDLFVKMADNLGYITENVGYPSYQAALKALRRGQIDVIAGAYYTKSNLGVGTSLMSPSFIENPIITIFVKGKEKNIKTFAELKGLKGVVRQEEVIYPLIYRQLLPGTDIKQVSGAKKAFKMLMDGEVDYMLTSLYSAEAEVRRFKLVDKIYFPSISLDKPNLFFAFASTSDCLPLKASLSKELRKLKDDKNAYRAYFIDYIDQWGQTFKDDAGLLEVETKTETISSQDENIVKDTSVEPVEKDNITQMNEKE